MRRCFCHTDLGQNAVFPNFAIQIALTKDSGRSKHACFFAGTQGTAKKISKVTYIYGKPVRTFDKRQSLLFKSRLIELYAST